MSDDSPAIRLSRALFARKSAEYAAAREATDVAATCADPECGHALEWHARGQGRSRWCCEMAGCECQDFLEGDSK